MLKVVALVLLWLQCANAGCSDFTAEADCWPARRQQGCWWEGDRCEYVVPPGFDLESSYTCTSQGSSICAGYVEACYELACGDCSCCRDCRREGVHPTCTQGEIDEWDGRGCPGGPEGGCSGGCCLGEYDDWCSDNYREDWHCANNACGDDDCCVPRATPIVFIVVANIIFLLVIVGIVVACCYCRKRHRQQRVQRTPGRDASAASGFAMSPGHVTQPCVATAMAQPIAQPMTQQVMVTCPAGVQPGDALQVAGPGGQVMQVSVPAGVMGGQQFMVQMPAAPVVRAVAVPAEEAVVA